MPETAHNAIRGNACRKPSLIRRSTVIWRAIHALRGKSGILHLRDADSSRRKYPCLQTVTQWCIAKNGDGYTQRGVAKVLKLPCLFMITEVSIRCQKTQEVGIRRIPAYAPPPIHHCCYSNCLITKCSVFVCIYLNQTTRVHRTYERITCKSPREKQEQRHTHAHTAHSYIHTYLSYCNKNSTGNT